MVGLAEGLLVSYRRGEDLGSMATDLATVMVEVLAIDTGEPNFITEHTRDAHSYHHGGGHNQGTTLGTVIPSGIMPGITRFNIQRTSRETNHDVN